MEPAIFLLNSEHAALLQTELGEVSVYHTVLNLGVWRQKEVGLPEVSPLFISDRAKQLEATVAATRITHLHFQTNWLSGIVGNVQEV